jgi:dUTP pyrophosphatase
MLNTSQEAEVAVEITAENPSLLPIYATVGAAGADVKAHIEEVIVLKPQERYLVPTGLRLAIPEGYEIQVRPRSGLAFKSGITVLNSPGTIDSDYRGELKILLFNTSNEAFEILPGMRIAQIVLAPVVRAQFILKSDIDNQKTTRGQGGFGHTGLL